MTLTLIRDNQTPSVEYTQPYVTNEADLAVELISAYTGQPDRWQTLCLESSLGRRANGLWSASTICLSVPRQNGKNYYLEVLELYFMVILELKIFHTAHEDRTAKQHFKRMKKYFEETDLRSMVKSVSNTNGNFNIILTNGAELHLGTRTKNASRGFTVDVLVMDEAQHLDSEALEALGPIISASPNPMQIFTGTPPGPGMSSEVFSNMRKHGLEKSMPHMVWLEWSADIGCDLDDEDAWAQANPGYPQRISKETIQRERATNVNDDAFGRERLGMWPQKNSTGVIDMKRWAELYEDGQQFPMEDPVVFGIDVNRDRTHASISVSGYSRRRDEEGNLLSKKRTNIVDNAAGTAWVVPRMMELNKKWKNYGVVIDSGSQASALILDLKRAGVRVIEVNFREHGRACGDFLADIEEGTLSHGNQLALNTACAEAKKRYHSEQWLWDKATLSTDITPLVAASLSNYGLSIKRRAPKAEKTEAETAVKKKKGRATVLR